MSNQQGVASPCSYKLKMTGIYIHVPFCIQRCHYCDFYSTLRLKDRGSFTDCIVDEILLRNDFIKNKNVDTIYFGGGTPSLLSPDSISAVIKKIYSCFNVQDDAEITMELNPDDMNSAYLSELAKTGVNRLSVGIQSFLDDDLKLMNRRHNSNEALIAVDLARKSGFESISIDLIYGLPNQELSAWKKNLEIATQMPVEHISAYHLIYEKGTNFYKWLKDGKLNEVRDQQSLEMFGMAIDILEENGFEQYEISNFARDKKYSRHNTKYWFGEEYLGLGPSAHSYNGEIRQWNIANLSKWMGEDTRCKIQDTGFKMQGQKTKREEENIDLVTRRNEMIMTRLRTMWGIQEKNFTEMFGKDSWSELLDLSSGYIKSGLLEQNGSGLVLSKEGKFMADGIISDLFLI